LNPVIPYDSSGNTNIDALVELISKPDQKNNSSSLFSREDLAYQEARRNRKVRKMEFEIK
jgi:hypothetical protein